MNSLYLRHRLKVVVPSRAGTVPLNVLVSMQRNLESLGFQLTQTPNGAAAIEAARKDKFDVVFLDFDLPDMTGPELIRHLKATIILCSQCQNLSETDPCGLCRDTGRDRSIICVVEEPLDLVALERM